jgi:hypothetical protein
MDNKRKNRFNIIDVLVIFTVLALIAGIIVFTVRESKDYYAGLKEKNITYTVKICGIEKEFLSSFKEKEHIFSSTTLNYVGTISKIRTAKTSVATDRAVQSASGSAYISVMQVYDDLFDVYLTVSAKASLDDRGIAYIDRRRISIGSAVDIRCGNFSATAYVTNFSIA